MVYTPITRPRLHDIKKFGGFRLTQWSKLYTILLSNRASNSRQPTIHRAFHYGDHPMKTNAVPVAILVRFILLFIAFAVAGYQSIDFIYK